MPNVGEVWHYVGKKERVRIGRVWQGYNAVAPGEWSVRCHPLHGGKYWVAQLTDFMERFERESASS